MTHHRVENGRRKFLLTVAGGIAGLTVGSLPARVLAQQTGGPSLSISTIGAGREGGALGALFVKAGHRVMFSSRHPDTLKGLADELGPLARAGTVAEALDFGDVVMVSFRIRRWSRSGRTTATRLRRKCW
jgi:8-hydroxy-5-deazaflavin:NADPH oxidoreductase